ncbi:MAG: peptide deformylase [Bacteroidales bacterium]|nr:peptide deformylase [Bacteroidales bacterium]
MIKYKLYITIIIITTIFSCTTNKKIKSDLISYSNLIMSADSDSIMKILTINNIEDSLILRKKCSNLIIDTTDIILKHLIKRMYKTVIDTIYGGVGIASPQVGINKRIIIVQRFDKKGKPFETYLNPKIIQYSKLKQGGEEGCLSIPNKKGEVCRSYAILIEYDGMDRTHHFELVEDFTAVIFQHEIDHLNGTLYIDRINPNIQKVTIEEFRDSCNIN